jgi:hypothetical protein
MSVVYPTQLIVGTNTFPIDRRGLQLTHTSVYAAEYPLLNGMAVPGSDMLLNVRCGLILKGHESECLVLKYRIAVLGQILDVEPLSSFSVIVPLDGCGVCVRRVQGRLLGDDRVTVGYALADVQPGTTLTRDQQEKILGGLCGEHVIVGGDVRECMQQADHATIRLQ